MHLCYEGFIGGLERLYTYPAHHELESVIIIVIKHCKEIDFTTCMDWSLAGRPGAPLSVELLTLLCSNITACLWHAIDLYWLVGSGDTQIARMISVASLASISCADRPLAHGLLACVASNVKYMHMCFHHSLLSWYGLFMCTDMHFCQRTAMR